MSIYTCQEKDVKFSVVIPLYNKENHIIRAVKSVIDQSYEKFELIIVDDGSTDASLRRVETISDQRIKVIKQENGGVSAARNKGIDEAQYDYVAFLDADDEWKFNYLANIKQLIDQFPHAGAYATAYEYRSGRTSVKPCYHYSHFAPDWCGIVPDYHQCAINSPIISASSVVVLKKVFTQVGKFPIGITRGEDLDMWSRIALNYDIVFKNTILSVYHLNADERATQKVRILEKSILKYAEERLSACVNDNKASASYKEYIIKQNILLADHYFHTGERKKAIEILWRVRNTSLNRKLWWKTLIKTAPFYLVATKMLSIFRSTNLR